MRVRSKSAVVIPASAGFHKKTAYWVPLSGPPEKPRTWLPHTAFTHPPYTMGLAEEMHDLTPLKSGGLSNSQLCDMYGFTQEGQKPTKPMQQVKGGVTGYQPITRKFTVNWPQTNGTWVITYECNNLPIPYSVLMSPYSIMSDYDSAAFHICGKNMLYNIGRGVAASRTKSNLFVFLAEAREIPRLAGLLSLRVRSMADAKSVVHNTHLGVTFGWAPLVNEIKEFLLTIQDFQERYIQLMKQQNITFKKSYMSEVTTGQDDLVSPWSYFGDGNAYRARDITKSNPMVMRAFARFRYRFPELPGGLLKTKLWMRALGLNPTPSKVWNLIPFTFIIDWFFNFSKVLRAFESELQSYDTIDAGYWWKGEITRETHVEQWANSVYIPLGVYVKQTCTYFGRAPSAVPTAPIPSDLLGTPDLQKALSLYSLISQRK